MLSIAITTTIAIAITIAITLTTSITITISTTLSLWNGEVENLPYPSCGTPREGG